MAEIIERWLGPDQFTGRVKFPFLDEFIASNVDIHFEAMGHAQFWMMVTCRETGRQWHLNFGAVSNRVKGYAMVEEDSAAPQKPLSAPYSAEETVPRVSGAGSDGEGVSRAQSESKCCPRFKDTGGFRIADLCCPTHGVNGTDPGDGMWDDE